MMSNDDILTVTASIAAFALISTFLTYHQLSKNRFNPNQTLLMAKVLAISLGITAIGGCYWSDACTDNATVKDWLFMVGIVGLALSVFVVPIIGGGLIGQAIGWCLVSVANAPH